jgi:predicted transcriptional regulator
MTIGEAGKILEAEVLTGADLLGVEVQSACGADLMSDVLAFSKEKVLLLTGLVNPQVIRTAEMMDIRAIAFVRGKRPSAEMLALADDHSIAVLTTEHPMYISCGLLYHNGLRSGGARD